MQLKLKAGKEKLVKNRHPWIFSGAIAHIPQGLEEGQEIELLDSNAHFVGRGHFCANDGIVLRMLTFSEAELINEDFFKTKFSQALALRKTLSLASDRSNGYRLIHGEGDGLSGLVCDIFAQSAVISSQNPGLKKYLYLLKDFLKKELNITSIYVDGEEKAHNSHVDFLENGLRFVANIGSGQKTGHFFDQRENRALLAKMAQGRSILDAFSYSGGFSVYALAAGAQSVLSLDSSVEALKLCTENVRINNLEKNHEVVNADCFTYLRSLKKDYFDLIILDPPAFTKSAHNIEKAARAYKDINLVAMKAIKANGLLYSFSCSQHMSMDLFKKVLFAAAKDAAREARILFELSQGPDHPVSLFCPQSSYLKGLVLNII
jgi:23S rRNA (cytosine1962-C5)-methyltransferase